MDELVSSENPIRIIDAFVEKLDMAELEFERSTPEDEGRPGFSPKDMLKLYIYGYFDGIKSSRRLERECMRNIEVRWLLNNLAPDFRTISNFRRDNKLSIKRVFKSFNQICRKAGAMTGGYVSIDGSKFEAVNSKDNNFTLSELDDRISRLDGHIEEYLNQLEENDTDKERSLTREELEAKIKECEERKARYEGYRRQLEESGESQLSTTGPEARLMKTSAGFDVCYNTQMAVEEGSHMIAEYEVTDSPTDHGQLTNLASKVKEDCGAEVLEVTADKGYRSPSDIADALANGIVPNVIRLDGRLTTDVEYSLNEAQITEEQRCSTKPKDLRRCLESVVIPEAYKDILIDVEIIERTETVIDESFVQNMSEEEMKALAKSGYFVRDPRRNLVWCPEGNILRLKSIKKDGRMRFCNKLACKECPVKCTKSPFKEADFGKDTLVLRSTTRHRDDDNKPDKGNRVKKEKRTFKVVRYKLRLDQNKMNNRKCLSEHPFGTIKLTMNGGWMLLKGKAKVEAEMALLCIGYNLRRAISILGVQKMVKAMA